MQLAEWATDSSQREFMDFWQRQIAYNDPAGSALVGNDVYRYLESKIIEVLSTKRNLGPFGQSFKHALCLGYEYQQCVIYCDGRSSESQQRPYTGTSLHQESWWPCIATAHAVDIDIFSMYCPALAWQGSRPWGAHLTRIRLFGKRDHNTLEPERPISSPQVLEPEPEEEPEVIILQIWV